MARRTELLALRIPANLSRPRRSLSGEAEALTRQVALLRGQLRELSVADRLLWDSRMTALSAEGSLGCWERIVLADRISH